MLSVAVNYYYIRRIAMKPNRDFFNNNQRSSQRRKPKPSKIEQGSSDVDSSHTLSEVVLFCQRFNLEALVCGHWVWCTLPEQATDSFISQLRNFGFHYSKRRNKWAHDCGFTCKPGKSDPFTKYPTYRVSGFKEGSAC